MIQTSASNDVERYNEAAILLVYYLLLLRRSSVLLDYQIRVQY